MITNILQSSFVHKILIPIMLLVSIVLAYLLVQFGAAVFIAVCGFFILFLLVFSRFNDKASLLIVLLISTLPLQYIFLTAHLITQVIAQLLGFIVIFYCWHKSALNARAEYLRKIKPLIFPTFAFVFSFFVSYLVSGKLEMSDWVFLFKLLGSASYAFLACFYCNTLVNIKRILWVFVAIGVIQLPVIYAQIRGWTDNLPAALERLSSYRWIELASAFNSDMIRVPGMFGDYELVAEYFDMMILVSVGFLLAGYGRKEKFFALLSILALITAGFYTGTRAFIWGLGGGLFVMLFFMLIRPGFGKNILNFLMIGGGLGLVITLLSNQEIFAHYIDRFINTEFSLNNYDSRNTVFMISFSLIPPMPILGYGPLFMEKFNAMVDRAFISPHSLYFSMLLRAGYPGLMAIFVMIFNPILLMLRVLFKNNTKEYHLWAIVFLSMLIFWTVNEIKIEFIRLSFYMNIIFFFLGIITSFYDLARRNLISFQKQETT